jgi:hypothetical protein
MATVRADPLALEQIKIFDKLKSERVTNHDSDYQSISDLMLPQDSNITVDKLNTNTDEWTQQVFDTTAILSAQVFMAGLYNWTTPQQQPWAGYASPKSLGDVGIDGQEFWDQATEDVMAAFGRSNFYSMRAMACLGLGVFGTDFLLFEEDEEQPGEFNFRHNRISTYVLEENYRGVVDTTRREFKMTWRQAEQMFNKPKDRIPEDMEKQGTAGETGAQRKFQFLHCIFPRDESKRLKGRRDGENKPIASVYISVDFKQVIRVSGYDEEPQLCPRFTKWGTDTPYGFGPAYVCLPEARELNYMAMWMDAAAEKLIDPRLLIPSNLEGDVDLRAGGQTIFDENVPQGMPREWASAAEYKLGLEIMEQKRNAIREAFLVTAFKFLNSQPLLDKKMTAYEVSQRLAEQLQSATPAIARSEPEFIHPCMRRAFGIRYRNGRNDPKSFYHKPPDSLMKRDAEGRVLGLSMPDVVVTSRFTDAMKALKNRSAEELMQFLMPQVENLGRPDILDPFDLDKINTKYGLNTGIDADCIRDEKGVKGYMAIRQARQAQQKAAAAAQLAESLGKAGAGLGRSPAWLQDKAQENLTGSKGRAA